MRMRATARAAFGEGGLSGMKLRAKCFAALLRSDVPADLVMRPSSDPHFERALTQRPDLAGVVLWPYQNAQWPAPERLERMCAHYRVMADVLSAYDHPMDHAVVLTELGPHMAGLRLVLDQPWWMMREGGLTLSLFHNEFRAFSISFSLGHTEDRLSAYIGGIQGRNVDHALDLYREMTKTLYGLRPRDLTVIALQYLLAGWGVKELHAVRTASQHHNHPFFGHTKHSLDYDAIWSERGGEIIDAFSAGLPMTPVLKPLDEVKAKKRKMYTARYAFLEQIEKTAQAGWPERSVVQINAT